MYLQPHIQAPSPMSLHGKQVQRGREKGEGSGWTEKWRDHTFPWSISLVSCDTYASRAALQA